MSIYRSQTFAAGGGIVDTDLNAISSFLRSQVFDTLGHLGRITENDVAPSTAHAYCVGNSGAPYAHTSGLTIKNLGGVLIQQQAGAADGNAPKFLAYYLAAEELNTTLAAADPSSTRFDTIAIKIDEVDDPTVTRHFKDAVTGALTTTAQVVTRGVRLQKQVVQGTVAGAEPAAPAGYVKWCSVEVPAASTSILPVNMIDHRMPIGLQTVDVFPEMMFFDSVGSWEIDGNYWRHKVANMATPAHPLHAYLPALSHTKRVLAVGYASSFSPLASATQIELGRNNFLVSAGSFTRMEGTVAAVPAADGTARYLEYDLTTSPTWANGYRAGYAARPPAHMFVAPDKLEAFGIRFTPDPALALPGVIQLYLVRFIVAGG